MAKETRKRKTVREFSAGGVVFKKQNDKVLWLVTKSTPSEINPKGFWRLPKGWLDDKKGGREPGPLATGERKATQRELKKTALKEVEEEGGVKAKIVAKIVTARWFRGKGVLKFITFYLMEYIADLPDGYGWETEEIVWFPYKKAREKLTHKEERKVLDKAKELLEAGIQENLV